MFNYLCDSKVKIMRTTRQELIALIDNGNIETSNIPKALELTGVWPNKTSWSKFLHTTLTWLGALAISVSVIFFIAFNWDDIGRFAKFAGLESVILASIGAYYFFAKQQLSQKVLLTVASLLTGALIAYFHQTYQTGADPWQLFFTWALLILPWVFAAQFAPLWFLFVVLLNITIYTYLFIENGFFGVIFDSNFSMLWTGFFVNAIILVLWELASTKFVYLKTRWPVRLIAIGSGFAISFLCLLSIFEVRHSSNLSPMIWLLSIAAIYYVYRKLKPDLFMLAAGCLSVIVIVNCFLAQVLFDDIDLGFGGLFILALCTIAMGGGSAMYLRDLHKEFNDE